MWRKQEETRPAAPSPEANAAPKVEPPVLKPVSPREASPPGGHLTKALKIRGEITGGEDIFIDGEVHGQIRLRDGRVTIGPSGRVVAGVEAREIVVRGKLKGDLNARERVQIDSTGSIIGDVVARRISINDGAELRGHVDTTRGEERHPARTPAGGALEVRPAAKEPLKDQVKEPLPTA